MAPTSLSACELYSAGMIVKLLAPIKILPPAPITALLASLNSETQLAEVRSARKLPLARVWAVIGLPLPGKTTTTSEAVPETSSVLI